MGTDGKGSRNDEKRRRLELVCDVLESLKWANAAEQQASVDTLEKYVVKQASSAILWYERRKQSKKHLSQLVRYSAIVLGALVGLLPVAAGVWPGIRLLEAREGSLFLSFLAGLAAALISLDRFGGFSTGWIRYVRTRDAIRRALVEFQIDMELARLRIFGLNPAGQTATPEQIEQLILRVREFLVSVETEVAQETQQWVMEFESNLAQLEKDVRAQKAEQEAASKAQKAEQEAAAKPGALKLTINNAAEFNHSFKVKLEGDTPIPEATVVGGDTWVHRSVAPGRYMVRVTAGPVTIGGNQVSGSSTDLIEVGPGSLIEKTLALVKVTATSP